MCIPDRDRCGLDPVVINPFQVHGKFGEQAEVGNAWATFRTGSNRTEVTNNSALWKGHFPQKQPSAQIVDICTQIAPTMQKKWLAALALTSVILPVLAHGAAWSAAIFAPMAAGDPPANDYCANAVPVPLALGNTVNFIGDNTDATYAGDAVEGTLLAQYGFANTWHAFTTTECSKVTVSYCGTNSGWTNVWKLLSTDCPASTIINASVSDQTTCANGNWTFSFNELPAGTYYLPVPNVGFGQGGGAYNIAVTAGSCNNDLCSSVVPQALPIGGSLHFIGDNTNATFAGDAVTGSPLADFPFANTWHAFTTSECSKVTVSYCGTNDGWSNVWRLLTTQCPADAVINATTEDTATCANHNWTFSFDALPAGTYYLPVPNVGFGQGGGAYSIMVGATQCGTDLCSAVVPVPLAAGEVIDFSGDNSNATYPGDAVPGSELDMFPSPNTWHAFTTTTCTKVNVSYCGTNSGWSNVWKLLTTQCPADAVINPSSQDQTTCGNGNWNFTFDALPAGTYYLPVPNVGFGQGGGPYNIQVTASLCSNDLCGNIIPDSLSVDSTVIFAGNNTSATFDGDAVIGTVMYDFPFPNTWHAFTTTTCANVTMSYCATPGSWNTVWKLISLDCPASTIINASTSDTTTCADGSWTFTFNELAPGTYYLPVPNNGFGQGGGPYSIAVSASQCSNDICGNVIPVDLLLGTTLTFTGDNTNATNAGDAVPGNLLEQFAFPNTWHAFTTNACANVYVDYCNTNAGWSNVWRLLTTQCPANTLINATTEDTSACANTNWSFKFLDLPAGTYYLPVPNVGFGQGGGPYNVSVRAGLCGFDAISESDGTNGSWGVYPNPTTGDVTFTTSRATGAATLELVDLAGRSVLREGLNLAAGATKQLSLAKGTAPGTYMLVLTNVQGRSVQRLVIR